jgi:diguanylate cyclase (GGDEF)-like protein
MKSLHKESKLYILLIAFITVLVAVFMYKTSEFNKDRIKEVIVSNAVLQFENMVNTRKWNAQYGGVYVKDNGTIKPNPYLKDNHFMNGTQRYIKINPAWMTRQLSEIENINNFSFRIISDNPLNKHNIGNKFELEGLEYLNKNRDKAHYYNINYDKKKFEFVGALIVEESCMACHAHQGYKIGDIRGGISIYKDIYKEIGQLENITFRRMVVIIIVILTGIIISILVRRIFSINRDLEEKVKIRTKELEQKSKYLERIKDSNKDILVVTNGRKLIDGNLAFMKFFNVQNIEEFLENNDCICDKFEVVDSEEYISHREVDSTTWANYVVQNRDISYKVKIINNSIEHVFLLSAEYLIDSNDSKILVVFSEITELEESHNRLEHIANIDELTKIMNRQKFNRVIEEEILFAKEGDKSLSIIFFDIDHFKDVNDRYGHDEGDRILVELTTVVKEHIRDSDFFARWGGEEFVIIIKANVENARHLAEKLRKMIQVHSFGLDRDVTCSFGVTEYDSSDSSDTLLKRADKALYTSKESGRNRVTCFCMGD